MKPTEVGIQIEYFDMTFHWLPRYSISFDTDMDWYGFNSSIGSGECYESVMLCRA